MEAVEAASTAPAAAQPMSDDPVQMASKEVTDSLRAENAALRRDLAALADALERREDAARATAQGGGDAAESPSPSSAVVRSSEPAQWCGPLSLRSGSHTGELGTLNDSDFEELNDLRASLLRSARSLSWMCTFSHPSTIVLHSEQVEHERTPAAPWFRRSWR